MFIVVRVNSRYIDVFCSMYTFRTHVCIDLVLTFDEIESEVKNPSRFNKNSKYLEN